METSGAGCSRPVWAVVELVEEYVGQVPPGLVVPVSGAAADVVVAPGVRCRF
ncbi:hypothetical protein NJB1604_34230 [Mycobacterium marinum]|nr:hypothetical protein NJB1604_34230 [Mycobacterium marinum]